jgi:hypothetical protein
MRLEDDDVGGGLQCVACSRLAFRDTPGGGLIRCDQEGLSAINAEELPACPKCGSLELWQTLTGNWRCLHCDPPTTSRRLAAQRREAGHEGGCVASGAEPGGWPCSWAPTRRQRCARM